MVETNIKRGLLIAVEGCDRSGKTTQCQHLVEWIQKHLQVDCEYWKFPDRTTPIGTIINQYLTGDINLNDQTVHLLFSANRWELKNKMEKKLMNGTWLVLDRYAESGVAYTGAKGLPWEWCKAPDHGLPAPDLTIFLDVPITEGTIQRTGYGAERYEREEFQIKVRKCFERLQSNTWTIVDGQGTIDQVSDRLAHHCEEVLKPLAKNHSYDPLNYLNWK